MKLFETEYKKDLLYIDKLLENEEDENIKKILLEDKIAILEYINSSNISKQLHNKKELDIGTIISFIKNNNLNSIKVKRIRIFYINYKKIQNLTDKFIENSQFNLLSQYLKIKSYNGIKFTEKKYFYLGFTIYINSLDKNYIHIDNKKSICDYFTLIHELGHARMNSLCKDSNGHFGEAYPIFLELVFCRYLESHGMIKESYNIKSSILQQLKDFVNELKHELNNYSLFNNKTSYNNYFLEYKFETAKSIILAFHLYIMYLSNPKSLCLKLDDFLKQVCVLSEEQLLNLLGLDCGIFDNVNFVYDIGKLLKDERIKIIKMGSRIMKK